MNEISFKRLPPPARLFAIERRKKPGPKWFGGAHIVFWVAKQAKVASPHFPACSKAAHSLLFDLRHPLFFHIPRHTLTSSGFLTFPSYRLHSHAHTSLRTLANLPPVSSSRRRNRLKPVYRTRQVSVTRERLLSSCSTCLRPSFFFPFMIL